MSVFQFLLIQVNLALFLGIYHLLSSGTRHRTVNRAYLLLMPFVAIGLPLISFETSSTTAIWMHQLPMIDVLQTPLSNPSSTPINWIQIFYFAGVFVFLGITIVQLFRVLYRPISVYRGNFKGSRVFELKENKASYSFFNRIYLNPNQLENEETILLHEHAHCKGWHSLDLLLIAVLKAVFWFNPIIHFWERRIRENNEYIADQYVLNHQPAAEYGQVLLEATFQLKSPKFVNAFNTKSLLLKRIENLKHKNQHHMKHLIVIPVAAGIAFLAASMNTPFEKQEVVVETSHEEITPAQFPGGKKELFNFIMEEVKYPEDLKNASIEGQVFVVFEISETGKIENANIAKSSTHEAMDDEALRIVNKMPNWEPAKKEGKSIRSKMTLPFNFAL